MALTRIEKLINRVIRDAADALDGLCGGYKDDPRNGREEATVRLTIAQLRDAGEHADALRRVIKKDLRD